MQKDYEAIDFIFLELYFNSYSLAHLESHTTVNAPFSVGPDLCVLHDIHCQSTVDVMCQTLGRLKKPLLCCFFKGVKACISLTQATLTKKKAHN